MFVAVIMTLCTCAIIQEW